MRRPLECRVLCHSFERMLIIQRLSRGEWPEWRRKPCPMRNWRICKDHFWRSNDSRKPSVPSSKTWGAVMWKEKWFLGNEMLHKVKELYPSWTLWPWARYLNHSGAQSLDPSKGNNADCSDCSREKRCHKHLVHGRHLNICSYYYLYLFYIFPEERMKIKEWKFQRSTVWLHTYNS